MYIVPFTCLAVFNLLIYTEVRRANSARSSLTRLQKKEIGLANLLMVVVMVFFVCNILALVVNILEVFEYNIIALHNVSNLLVTFNSSVNLIIYCIFGEKFKRIFCQLFCHRSGGRGDGMQDHPFLTRYPHPKVVIVKLHTNCNCWFSIGPDLKYLQILVMYMLVVTPFGFLLAHDDTTATLDYYHWMKNLPPLCSLVPVRQKETKWSWLKNGWFLWQTSLHNNWSSNLSLIYASNLQFYIQFTPNLNSEESNPCLQPWFITLLQTKKTLFFFQYIRKQSSLCT